MTAEQGFPTEWTPEVARRLAVPFEDAQVGRKPQGGQKVSRDQYVRCTTCKPPQKAPPNHFHVDYVDHAVVTGRLNDVVGPHGWSYTITSVERDGQGNLTAIIGEMTVLGHTKGPEVGGPGGQADAADDRFKSAISDYLKRAAARFGVGLDLWTKQALESAAETESKPAAPKKSKPGGTGERSGGLERPTPVAGALPDQGEASDDATTPARPDDGAPPGFDHLTSPGKARAWLRGQPDALMKQVLAGAAQAGVSVGEASLETLQRLILDAWRQQEAA